jgi:hypothetical protein
MNKYNNKNEYSNDLIDELVNKKNVYIDELYKTYKSDKIVLDIETDCFHNILQIAYNMYDNDNNLICSKNFYVYDGEHSNPFFPTIEKKDIIEKGISLEKASDIITQDICNEFIWLYIFR